MRLSVLSQAAVLTALVGHVLAHPTTPAGNATAAAAGLMSQTIVTLPDTGGTYTLYIAPDQPVVRLRTRKGATVVLRIQGQKADELHLHGYDITHRLETGKTGTLQLTAKRSGRFELETHSDHRTRLVLEVMP